MDRLLTLRLRKATEIDESGLDEEVAPTGYLYEPQIPIDDVKKVLDYLVDEKKEVNEEAGEGVEIEIETEEPVDADAPSVEEIIIHEQEDEVHVSKLGAEDTQKLLSRLQNLEDVEEDVEFFKREQTVKALPEGFKTEEIDFPPKEQRERAKAVSGRSLIPLKVTSYTPTTSINKCEGQIKITFNQSMYQEELKISNKKEEVQSTYIEHKRHIRRIIHVSPDLPPLGEWKWQTPNTCVFSTKRGVGPGGLFFGSTEYSVVVPRGTKSVKGSRLEESVSFKFFTPRLSVINFLPRSASTRVNTVAPVLGIQFSQDVDPKKALEKLKVVRVGKLLKKKQKFKLLTNQEVVKSVNELPFFLTQRNTDVDPIHIFSTSIDSYLLEKERKNRWSEKMEKYKISMIKEINKKDVFFFTLEERLDHDTQYQIIVAKDLESVHGNLRSEIDFKVSFRTMNKLDVSSWTNPSHVYEYDKFEWCFHFYNTLNESIFEKGKKNWIAIENILEPQVWIDKDKMFVKGRIMKNVKQVKIVLNKVIEDVFNNLLDKKKEYIVEVHLREFHPTSDKKQKVYFQDKCCWKIYFNQSINKYHFEDNIEKLVKVEPKLLQQKVSFHGSNCISIEGSPIGSLSFAVKISSDLETHYETRMKKDHVIKYKLKKVDKLLESVKGNIMEVVDPLFQETIKYTFYCRNIKKIRVVVFKVDPIDFYKCPIGPNKTTIGDYSDLSIDLFRFVNIPKNKVVFDEYVETKGIVNEKKIVSFELEKYLSKEKTGNLFIVCEFPKKKSANKNIFSWIQCTKLSVEAFWQNQQNLILIGNSLVNGSVIPNPLFEIQYSESTKRECYEYLVKKDDEYPKIVWEFFDPSIKKLEYKGNEDGYTEQVINMGRESCNFQILIREENDVAFIPDVGRSFKTRDNQLIAFVFDDKKIFKPKEKAHVKVVLRMINFANQERKLEFVQKGEKISYKIFDARNVKFIESELIVDEFSSLYFNFPIPDNINLGDCKIEFVHERNKANIGGSTFYHNFKVEEFKEPEFDTKCKVHEREQYKVDDKTIVTTTAKYYSGGSLSDSKTKWLIKQKHLSNFKPPGFSKYNFKYGNKQHITFGFSDYNNKPKNQYSFQDTTDSMGRSKIFLELKNPMNYVSTRLPNVQYTHNNPPPCFPTVYINKETEKMYILPLDVFQKSREVFQPIQISCSAEVTDISMNVLRSSTKFTVHPCEFYIGVYAEKKKVVFGETLSVEMIVCDSKGNMLKDKRIAVEIYRYAGTAKKRVMFVETKEEVNMVNIEFFEQWLPGSYDIIFTGIDKRGLRALTSLKVTVENSKEPVKINVDRELKKMEKRFHLNFPIDYKERKIIPERINIHTDKETYLLGETANIEISMQTKFSGKGLILIYGTKILHRQFIEITDVSKLQTYKFSLLITEDHLPNFTVFSYVFGKQFRKDVNNFEITEEFATDDDKNSFFKPGHFLGKTNITVSPKTYEVSVEVTPKDTVMTPGSESEISVQVKKEGKSALTMFIVDESVLALTGYKMNLDINFFFPQTDLSYSGEALLRNYIFEKKLKANMKIIEKEKQKMVKKLEDEQKESELKNIQLKRNTEFRKMKADEISKEDMKKLDKLKAIWKEQQELLLSEIRTVSKPSSSYRRISLQDEICESSFKLKSCDDRMMKKSGGFGLLGAPLGIIGGIADGISGLGKKKKSMAPPPRMQAPGSARSYGRGGGRARGGKQRNQQQQWRGDMKKKSPPKPSPARFFGEIGSVSAVAEEEEDTTPIAMRKLFQSTVVFTTCVITDEHGYAAIPFKLPDNLTRYVVYVLAENGEKYFGLGESTFVSKLPFSIRESVPKYLNFGDTCNMKFILSNQTDDTLKIKCAVRTTKHLDIVEKDAGFFVNIPKSKRAEVIIPMETKKVGKSKIQVGASAKGYSDALEKSINIFTPSIAQAFVVHGQIDDKEKVASNLQSIVPPSQDEVYKGFGGLEIELSSTIMQSLKDAFLYTFGYQYDCVEQSSSRIISIVSMYDIIKEFKKFGNVDCKEAQKVLKAALKKLCKRQQSSGGFGMWTKSSSINPYVSVLAAHAVIRVRDMFSEYFTDFSKPEAKDFEKLLNNCKSFCISISSYFPFGIKRLSNQSIRSFSLYVLAHYKRLGLLSDSEIKKCNTRVSKLYKEYQKKSNGTLESRAWLAFGISQFSKSGNKDDKVKALMTEMYKHLIDEKGRMYFTNKINYESDSSKLVMIGDGPIRTNGIILEVLCHLDVSTEVLVKMAKNLMKMRKMGRWKNTNENSTVLLGITTYLKKVEKNKPDFEVDVWLKKLYCGGTHFKGRETTRKMIKIPMKDICITPEEKEKIEKEKMALYETFEKNRDEREKREEEEKKKEEEERENEKKKKKGFFSGIKSLINREDASNDLSFFQSQIEKKKGKLSIDEKEEEMEEKLIKQICNKQLLIQKTGKGMMYYRMKMKFASKDLKLNEVDLGFKISRTYHSCVDKTMEVKKKKVDGVWEEDEKTMEVDGRTGRILVKVGSLVRVRITFETNKPRYQIALVDNVPACLEVLNPNLKTTIPIPRDQDGRFESSWYEHKNYRSERVEVFKDKISSGSYRFTYVCRVKHVGLFHAPPAKCEEMYDEEIFGSTSTNILVGVDNL